ncbi:MAG: hypothetical protein KatS3mg002_0946 [Candidatus Woesearchaeota archaeon]|nr:MAG: hypothetical protein KatS3mg002_0946 [Candidatus Woesearchaeota archaeon]
MATEFTIVPVIVIGVVLGIIELIFVHQDESGMGWLKHGLHALPTMFLFIFISMNIGFVLGLFKMKENFWIDIGVRVVVGLIAMVKIKAAAAVAGRVGEKTIHVIIIGVLVMAAPYLWELIACNIEFIKNLPMNGCPVKK